MEAARRKLNQNKFKRLCEANTKVPIDITDQWI